MVAMVEFDSCFFHRRRMVKAQQNVFITDPIPDAESQIRGISTGHRWLMA
jgi:hypothetical protein